MTVGARSRSWVVAFVALAGLGVLAYLVTMNTLLLAAGLTAAAIIGLLLVGMWMGRRQAAQSG